MSWAVGWTSGSAGPRGSMAETWRARPWGSHPGHTDYQLGLSVPSVTRGHTAPAPGGWHQVETANTRQPGTGSLLVRSTGYVWGRTVQQGGNLEPPQPYLLPSCHPTSTQFCVRNGPRRVAQPDAWASALNYTPLGS